MLSPRRPRHATAFTLIELLVVITIIALLIGILLPSLGRARLSARTTACAATSKSIAQAALAYGADHQSRCPPDRRTKKTSDPMTNYRDAYTVSQSPTDEDTFKLTWLGILQAGNYIDSDPASYDCPVVDDHRKLPQSLSDLPPGQQRIWYTDYVMALYAINQSPETAADPLRAPLISEPSQAYGAVWRIEYTIASKGWFGSSGKGRDDLEQKLAGSLSFAFADGHVSRIPILKEDPYPAGRTFSDLFPDLYVPSFWASRTGNTMKDTYLIWQEITLANASSLSMRAYIMNGPQTQ